ncbi:hypothetical protein GCM10023235_33690 [Kitasatospora terrestris]|uniref:Uncharacterized protein n=1 Tax=Kitasatospora terrestris TaxID=258051 RepID=A0ABP9DQX6_9ACTN
MPRVAGKGRVSRVLVAGEIGSRAVRIGESVRRPDGWRPDGEVAAEWTS